MNGEWYAGIRANIGKVLLALAAVGAVFGLDINPAEQAGLMDGLDKLVASTLALFAGGKVLVSTAKEAVKSDPAIHTDPPASE